MTDFALIAGLGNPGPGYAHNRHNIGFQAVDALADAHGLPAFRTEHRAATAHGTIGGQRVVLAKPQTWMNDSGQAVAALVRYYKVEPAHLLVIYDDLDIPLGTVRYRPEGSSGGHRGIDSIIQHLDTRAFPRLRLGIGRPPGRMPPAAYVLQDFSEEEAAQVWDVLRFVRERVTAWLTDADDFRRQAKTWRIEENV